MRKSALRRGNTPENWEICDIPGFFGVISRKDRGQQAWRSAACETAVAVDRPYWGLT